MSENTEKEEHRYQAVFSACLFSLMCKKFQVKIEL